MSAFLSKIGVWFSTYLGKAFLTYLKAKVETWWKRARKNLKQNKEDKEARKPYEDAVKNGTIDEIKKATEDRFRR